MIDHDIARWIFVIAGLCIFTRHKWWPKMQALTRTPQKSLDHPQAGETVDPAAQEHMLKPDELTETHKKPTEPQEGEAEKPEVQEQPPKPAEPPEEPRRGRMAWEIKAERAQQFAVYEAACVLTGKAPRWPFRKDTPEENEYELLRLALLNDELGGELAYEAGFAEGDGGDDSRLHLVESGRQGLRNYLQAKGRKVPRFLHEQFD